jgi:hypothetical protein
MSFILLSHWNGRFGNRMHQYAYGATYSKLHNVDFILTSDWEGTYLFKNQQHKVSEDDEIRLYLNQTNSEFHTEDMQKHIITKHYPTAQKIYPESDSAYLEHMCPVYFDSVCAYSKHVFAKQTKKHLLDIFELSDEVKETNAYNYWSDRRGTYDIAHLRRDDVSNASYNKINPQGYSVISKKSYIKAFKKFGFNPEEIEWTSDDYTGKWHADRKSTPSFGWAYPAGSIYKSPEVFDWLEDFLRLYFARTIFRANSSFSWWASFLSPTATVYSPVLDKQLIYGRDDREEEIEIEFVKGNYPHWMYGVPDIRIK